MKTPRRILIILLLIVSVVAAACDSSGDGEVTSTTATDSSTATTSADVTTTSVAPVTSVPPESIPGSNSDSIPDDVAAAMRAEIGVIMLDVEESRALPFLEIPTVTILDDADFRARVASQIEEDVDEEEIATQEAMLKLLGMLDEDDDLGAMLLALYTEQVAGFYDPEAGELVVPVSVDGITPLQEITINHELVHALTNQHFEFDAEYERRIDEGTLDDASALLAVVEGDATYQQLLYLESFDPAKAAQAALEALSIDTAVYDAAPTWMQQDLAFPYEYGFTFTGFLVDGGGLKAVDEAYQAPPVSTEQILDPNKYLRGELPAELEMLSVEIPGWQLSQEATLGEWGIRMLLVDTLAPGVLTQTAAGWGNDTYQFLTNEDSSTFVWSYVGETVEDAEDLANGLIAHARDQMGASGGEESGGGLLFAAGSPYVFIDRIDDAIFFIASTDRAALVEVRAQLEI